MKHKFVDTLKVGDLIEYGARGLSLIVKLDKYPFSRIQVVMIDKFGELRAHIFWIDDAVLVITEIEKAENATQIFG